MFYDFYLNFCDSGLHVVGLVGFCAILVGIVCCWLDYLSLGVDVLDSGLIVYDSGWICMIRVGFHVIRDCML